MRELSSEELPVLVQELRVLKGFYVDNFYEIERNKFRIKLTRRGERLNLQIILPYTINITEYIEKKEEATNFAIAARKRLAGFAIETIEQYNDDRIIRMEMRRGEESINIIAEMFGKGNLVITDNEMQILLAYQVHTFRDREIKPKIEYVPPKKNVTKEPKPIDIPKFIAYKKNDEVVGFALAEQEKYKELEKREFESFQKLLDFLSQNMKREEQKNPRAEELKASIEKQRNILKEIDEEIENNKITAATIFKNMQAINRLIEEASRNKHATREALQAIAERLRVLEVSLKEKSLTIEVI